jgi:hypothetical protein
MYNLIRRIKRVGQLHPEVVNERVKSQHFLTDFRPEQCGNSGYFFMLQPTLRESFGPTQVETRSRFTYHLQIS